ncbi:hypothetical protein ACFL54_03510 [Planctomycetota bacterium]
MWIVKNVLRGTLYIDDLDVKIPPKEYFDLDKLGRDLVGSSEMLKLAFEEGYLQNIKKDIEASAPGEKSELPISDGSEEIAAIEQRLREMQEMIQRGFSLNQIESRLNHMQKEMAESGAYSEQLQSLILEFRNTLLAKPAQSPSEPQPMQYYVPQSYLQTPAQPAQPQGQASSNDRNSSAGDAQQAAIQEKMNSIMQTLCNLQNAIINNQSAGSVPAQAGAPLPQTPPAQPMQEMSRLMDELDELKKKLSQEANPGPAKIHGPESVTPNKLSDELSDFRNVLLSDFKGLLKKMPVAAQGEMVGDLKNLEDMSEGELQARMALLQEKETEIQSNFKQIGKISEGESNVESMADLLCDI